MNVLFVTHHDSFQGSSRSLMSLLEGLRYFNVNPFVAIPTENMFTETLTSRDIPTRIIPMPWWVSSKELLFRKKWQLLKTISHSTEMIQELIKEWNIDLVYTNSSVIPVGRLAAFLAHKPHIWHIREYGDLDFSLRYIYPKCISQLFLNSSDAIICHSKAVRNYRFNQKARNVYQIYNGVADRAQFDSRLSKRNSMPTSDVYTFSMMSGITPKKGQEAAIKALAELRKEGVEARLILGGHGKSEYLEYLRGLCREVDLEDRVTFTGFMEDPFPIYYQSNCALVCSEYEAFSRVALEAMSTALPVIGKNSGGNPEIIVHGETGFLYESIEELIVCMKNIVQESKNANQMGLAGWQRARELFTIEDYAENVFRVVDSLL